MLKLGHKLLLAPIATAAVVLAVSQIDAQMLRHTNEAATVRFRDNLSEVKALSDIQAEMGQIHIDIYRMITIIGSIDEATINGKRQEFTTRVSAIRSKLSTQADSHSADSAQQELEASQRQLDNYAKQADSAIDLSSIDPNTGVAAMQGADDSYKQLSTLLQTAEANLIQDASQQASAKAAETERIHWLLSLLSVAASVAVVWIAAIALRKVAGALEESSRVAQRVAEGDLTHQVQSTRKDELGDLQRALARMRESLLNTVTQVRMAAENINTASTEVASGNMDLSQRTEQSASSLEETAASIEELTSTVRNSADAARQANQLATRASDIAARGGEMVGQVVATMDDIQHSSRKINDIIGVIDSIAFQTNILALNAAVEAARAGEQGRGFAVVASEVRGLAQRSALAANEIKELIGSSVDKVNSGSRLVATTGDTMNEIVESVQRVTNIISEITVATSEQSQGIEQINIAVSQLDQMTQQNAALVEQGAAAAESLKDQARSLIEMVEVFRLDDKELTMHASLSGTQPPGIPAPQRWNASVPAIAR